MDDVIIPLVLTLLALLSFFFFFRRPRKWNTPPSPSKLPVIGHLHLISDMPHHSFSRISDQLGPIIYLQLGHVPTVVVSSARLAREILKTHDQVFSSRPQLISAQYLSFGCSDITFSRYGPYWRQARKICVTELLSPKRVSSFAEIRDQEVNRLLAFVSGASGSQIDMSNRFFTLANNVLCRVAFGKRFIEEDDGEVGTKNRLAEILTEAQALFAGFSVSDFYPRWEWLLTRLTGLDRRLKSNQKDLTEVCDEIIREHLSNRKNEKDHSLDREDFVDVLLRVQKGDDLKVPISNDNLKALVLDMFVAGTDTTSATLEWVMTELARHPSVIERAQDEVRQVVGRSKGRVEETDLQHLSFLKAVIKETMRLHPTVPLLVPRESMDNCVLDGYDVPAGARVLINTYAIGRDPQSWDNPLAFNPGRFFQADGVVDASDEDFRFLPFGGGRRGCPGYSFALATVEIAMARLLYHFDWGLPHGVKTSDIDMTEAFGLATKKKMALNLVPTRSEGYAFMGVDA